MYFDIKPTTLTLRHVRVEPTILGPVKEHIFKQAPMTDLAILCGGYGHPDKPITSWWLRTWRVDGSIHLSTAAYMVMDSGTIGTWHPKYLAGVRPALPPESTSLITRGTPSLPLCKEKDYSIIFYGKYPQSVASNYEQGLLNREYLRGKLSKTGKKYTFFARRFGDFFDCDEYRYNSEMYIRTKYFDFSGVYPTPINDGRVLVENGHYWIRVSPIEWLVDPSGWWVMKRCPILMPYMARGECAPFEWTTIGRFLLEKFANQIQPNTR